MVIQYYLTDAGRDVALNAASLGLNVSLSHIAIGSGKYNPLTALSNTALVAELARFPLNGGGIEPSSHTLRFVSSIEPNITADGFEIGIFTDAGVLFAIAATTTNSPLIRLVENIVTISTFGMILSTISLANLIITIDPNTPVCVALMNQHLDHPNPHPQYALNVNVNALDKYSLLKMHVLDLSNLNPDIYYPVTIDILDKQDCKFYIDTPLYSYHAPWSSHSSMTINIYAEWNDYPLGWGENNGLRIIDKYDFNATSKSPILNINQITLNSFVFFYARGGTKYNLYTEKTLVPVIHTENFHVEVASESYDLNLINESDVNSSLYPEATFLEKRAHLDAYDPHPQYARHTDLENEQLWRENADNTLQSKIDQERGWRESADADLLQRIGWESDARIWSDNLLNDKIDLKLDKAGGTITGTLAVNTQIITPALFLGNFSTTTNGFTTLPNGLIMQFGFMNYDDMTPMDASSNTYERSGLVDFPTHFPSFCLFGSATICVKSNETVSSDTWAQVRNITKNGMGVINQSNAGALNPPKGLYWMAIGY